MPGVWYVLLYALVFFVVYLCLSLGSCHAGIVSASPLAKQMKHDHTATRILKQVQNDKSFHQNDMDVITLITCDSRLTTLRLQLKNSQLKNSQLKNSQLKNSRLKNLRLKNLRLKNLRLKNLRLTTYDLKTYDLKTYDLRLTT